MAIVGVLGCTALLVSAFGMYDSMHDTKVWQLDDINHYESQLNLYSGLSPSILKNIVSAVDGEEIMESSIEIQNGDNKQMGSLLVAADDSLISATNADFEKISLPSKGTAISQKMADRLGVKIGDKIKWHIFGENKWVESKITGVYSSPRVQGIRLSPKEFENLGLNFTPTSVITKEKVKKHYPGVESITTKADYLKHWNQLVNALMIMVYILIFFAVVLGFVVLYNLGLLSFTEIEREMATLKVLGFKTRKLRALLLTQNIIFSIVGYLIGIPVGYYLLKTMLDGSGRDITYPIHIHLLNLVLSFIITFTISITVNLLFSRKIKNIDMVESLKGLE